MTYPKAPIKEAVFDVSVDRVENTDINSYESLSENELTKFPKTERKVQFSGKLKFDTTKPNVTSEGNERNILGIIFSNSNSNIKIQFRKNGYTLNMLEPYTSWNDFSSIAFKYWEIYKKRMKPNKINRIGLRYINEINLPLKSISLNEYLKFMPEIPNVLKIDYSNLFLKLKSNCKDSENDAIIIRTFNKPKENILPFILDIDVYEHGELAEKKIKDKFEVMRNDKNNIFESLITDKTRNLFK